MTTPLALAAELLQAAGGAAAATRVVVQGSAKRVKEQGRANAKRSAPTHNAGAPDAITYETRLLATSVVAEIGYDKNKPGGALGNLLEYGGGGDHSPPHRDLGRALYNEEPSFLNGLAAMAKGLL